MEVGKTIRSLRELKGWTQVDLANASGINVNSIRKYENGFRNPKAEQVDKIADALQVNRSLFYDLNIKSVGDVMSLLFEIEDSVNLEISEISKDGKLSFTFDFEHPMMRESLHKWCMFKEAYNKDLKKLEEIKNETSHAQQQDELEKTYEEFKLRLMVNGPESNHVITKGTEGIAVKLTDWL